MGVVLDEVLDDDAVSSLETLELRSARRDRLTAVLTAWLSCSMLMVARVSAILSLGEELSQP